MKRFWEYLRKKIIRKICNTVGAGNDFRIRIEHELNKLLNDIDDVERINIHWLHWFGHVIHRNEN